jgi:hypothetical protein
VPLFALGFLCLAWVLNRQCRAKPASASSSSSSASSELRHALINDPESADDSAVVRLPAASITLPVVVPSRTEPTPTEQFSALDVWMQSRDWAVVLLCALVHWTQTAYGILVQITLQLLQCRSAPDDSLSGTTTRLVLFASGDVACFQGWQVFLIILTIFLWVPFPLALAYLIYRARKAGGQWYLSAPISRLLSG